MIKLTTLFTFILTIKKQQPYDVIYAVFETNCFAKLVLIDKK
jgi:hypothetical protein